MKFSKVMPRMIRAAKIITAICAPLDEATSSCSIIAAPAPPAVAQLVIYSAPPVVLTGPVDNNEQPPVQSSWNAFTHLVAAASGEEHIDEKHFLEEMPILQLHK